MRLLTLLTRGWLESMLGPCHTPGVAVSGRGGTGRRRSLG